MPQAAHSPARFLAPLALLVCVAAFLGVILSSTADDEGGSDRPTTVRTQPAEGKANARRPRPGRRFYTVRTGDTLGGIADRTGIEQEVLQRLNPELDPQTLVTGQKIKLRE